MKAASIVTATWYTPKSEEGKDAPTRFKLRGLTGIEFLEVSEHVKLKKGKWSFNVEAQKISLKYGLVDWEKFTDENGDVAFSYDYEINLSRLPATIIRELSNEIIEARTQLAAEDEKK